MLTLTLSIFSIFVVFQLIYIFLPLWAHKPEQKSQTDSAELGISILIPAYNEENIILSCIQGALELNYRNYEIIVINDGSSDETFKVLCDALHLESVNPLTLPALTYQTILGLYRSSHYSKVLVIDKANGGKADALNAGIDHASNEIIVTLDADSILEANSMKAINRSFHDSQVLGAGGIVHIVQGLQDNVNNPTPTFKVSGLIKYQVIQYLTAFYLHKFVHAKLNALTVIAGAFGAFRKSALIEVNGYRNTVGEDMDITLRIQSLIHTKEKDKKLVIVSDAICFTECPETYNDIFKQRIRWQKAFIDCVLNYGHYLFHEFGFNMSIFLLLDSFLLGTLISFNTLMIPFVLIITKSGFSLVLGLLLITYFLGVTQSIVSLWVSKRFNHCYGRWDLVRIYSFAFIEVITYRLLGLFWVTYGTLTFFLKKHDWNKINRYGKQYELDHLPLKGGA